MQFLKYAILFLFFIHNTLTAQDSLYLTLDRVIASVQSEDLNLQAESKELFGNVSKNDRAIATINAYYQLLIEATQIDIFEDLIIEKEDLIQQLKVQVSAGQKLESELLLAQDNKQRLQLQVQDTQQSFQQAMSKILVVLNVSNPVAMSLQLADLQLIDFVTMEDISNGITKGHPIIAYKRKLAATQKTTASEKKERWIPNRRLRVPNRRLSLQLGSFRQGNTNEFGGGFSESIEWSVPVFKLRGGGNAKINKKQRKLQAIEIEQQNLSNAHETIEYQIQLLEAKEAVAVSEEGNAFAQKALEQAYSRQEAEIGNAPKIAQAQEEYIQALLLYLNAIANYNVLQFRLWVALGNDF